MNDYDVIVVGAGPAGSVAAKAAAENGAKTILLEEHPEVGIPEHCVGMTHPPKGSLFEQLVERMDKRVVAMRLKSVRLYAPNGKMRENMMTDQKAYVVERNRLDLELAKLAAKAGAEISVNTRVTSLIHEDGNIVGVNTNVKTMSEIRGKVVIATNGIRAPLNGIPKWEGLVSPSCEVLSGIKWVLTNVKGLTDSLETHLGAFCERGWLFLAPIGEDSCYADIASVRDLERIRKGNWPCSEKFRDCVVLRMVATAHAFPMGAVHITKTVKNGLLLAGDAARGLGGVDHAIETGNMAGQVAAKAVKKGDYTERTLKEYEDSCKAVEKKLAGYSGGMKRLDRLNKLSDEQIQKIFDEVQVV